LNDPEKPAVFAGFFMSISHPIKTVSAAGPGFPVSECGASTLFPSNIIDITGKTTTNLKIARGAGIGLKPGLKVSTYHLINSAAKGIFLL
jgi:hypothetical protein